MLTKFLQISKEMLTRASLRLQKTRHGKLSTFLFNILCQHLASVNQLGKCLEKTGRYNFMGVGYIHMWVYPNQIYTSFYLKCTYYLYTKFSSCHLCVCVCVYVIFIYDNGRIFSQLQFWASHFEGRFVCLFNKLHFDKWSLLARSWIPRKPFWMGCGTGHHCWYFHSCYHQ